MKKTGRNDNCPCGSGLKYKKCCQGKTVPRRALVIKTISVELPIGTMMVEDGEFFVKKDETKGTVPHQVTLRPFGKPTTQNVPNFTTKVQVENMPRWFKILDEIKTK